MTSPPSPRSLDGVARELLAPLLDGTKVPRGWRLVGWDCEQAISVLLENDRTCISIEAERRNDDLDCYTRTRRFNICVGRQFEDADLDDADRAMVDAVIDVLRQREDGLPEAPREELARGAEVREILVDRLLMPEGKGHYYINPYAGCMIACPFCYVIDRADFSRELDGAAERPWGRYLDVKVNAADILRREVSGASGGIVRMSPILTDPYQPAEKRYRITRQCLEVLADTDLAPVILTRAPRILEDLEILQRFPRALVGFSIPTDTDEYRRIFEPRADPIEDRLMALRRLHAAGVTTFAVIQPVLPMNIDRMVEEVAPYVRAVRLDKLYVGERIRHVYEENGLSEYCSESWFADTIARLAAAFERRGVAVESLDNFEPLLG